MLEGSAVMRGRYRAEHNSPFYRLDRQVVEEEEVVLVLDSRGSSRFSGRLG